MRRWYREGMRTTLNLDDDVLRAARAIADVRGGSLGAVISDLARRALLPSRDAAAEEDGFPVFAVEPGASPITPAMVKAALEE
jgi:hypothetical protein